MTPVVSILKTEEHYTQALSVYEQLLDKSVAGSLVTEEADQYALLGLLLRAYEDQHKQTSDLNPTDFVQFMLEQRGLEASFLVQFLGSQADVAAFLNNDRKLTLQEIIQLHGALGLPYETLIAVGG
jgi:antitoxin component HigA of HigAB toxin-antitoxin module